MKRHQMDWSLSVLALITAIIVLLAGAWINPGGVEYLMLAAACMSFALWLVIGLRPDS